MGQNVGQRYKRTVHRQPEVDDSLPVPYAKVGIEIEVEGYRTKEDLGGWLNHWSIKEDHSLRNNGMEFVTDQGMVGKDIKLCIENICKLFRHNKYSEGYPRAGIHFHIDVTDLNEHSNTQLLNLVLAYMLFEKAVFRFAGEWREACGFCDPLLLSQRDFPNISALLYDWNNLYPLSEGRFSKYQAINFLPLARFGTLEFRQLPTTFDAQRIIDWLCICLSFKQYAVNYDVDPVDYMDKYGVDGLVNAVFGKWRSAVDKYIVDAEIKAAALEVRSLRIGRSFSGKKAVKPVLDSWDKPDNPLLLSKIEQAPKRPAAKKIDAATLEAVALDRQHAADAALFGAGREAEWLRLNEQLAQQLRGVPDLIPPQRRR